MTFFFFLAGWEDATSGSAHSSVLRVTPSTAQRSMNVRSQPKSPAYKVCTQVNWAISLTPYLPILAQQWVSHFAIKQNWKGWSDSIQGRVLALPVAYPGSMPGTSYSPKPAPALINSKWVQTLRHCISENLQVYWTFTKLSWTHLMCSENLFFYWLKWHLFLNISGCWKSRWLIKWSSSG